MSKTATAAVKKASAASATRLKARAQTALSRVAPTESLELFYRTVPTPLGPFSLFVDAAGAVRCCHWQRCATADATALAAEQRDVCASLQDRWYKAFAVHMAEPSASVGVPGDRAAALLNEYFNPSSAEAGRPEALERLLLQVPVAYPPCTAFMSTTWDVLRRTVPSGATTSYKELGRRVGVALSKSTESAASAVQSAPRAIGVAMGANPIPVIVPCHRVVSSTGALRGYGLGLRYKVWLLRHEQADMPSETLRALESESAVSTAVSLR